jgi:hypothetical protein
MQGNVPQVDLPRLELNPEIFLSGRDGVPPRLVAGNVAKEDEDGDDDQCDRAPTKEAHVGSVARGSTALNASVQGDLAFDAQLVAVCREHGVVEILTEDRDFARFETPRPIRLQG